MKDTDDFRFPLDDSANSRKVEPLVAPVPSAIETGVMMKIDEDGWVHFGNVKDGESEPSEYPIKINLGAALSISDFVQSHLYPSRPAPDDVVMQATLPGNPVVGFRVRSPSKHVPSGLVGIGTTYECDGDVLWPTEEYWVNLSADQLRAIAGVLDIFDQLKAN